MTERKEQEASYNAKADEDWWAQQELFGAPLVPETAEIEHKQALRAAYHEEQAKLYQEKLDMGLLPGSGVKPNLKEISKHFVQKMKPVEKNLREVGKAARKATVAFKEAGEKVGRVKKEYVPQPHLTHRPFKTREMQILREQLQAAQR